MNYLIVKNETKELISMEDMALEMARAGSKIIYCDIEGITEIDGTFYILDECGNWDYIDSSKYFVSARDDNYLDSC